MLALLPPFWPSIDVRWQSSFPSHFTLLLPFLYCAGPLNLLDTMPPPAVPPSSPLDIVISEPFTIVFLPSIFTLSEHVPPSACVGIAMFGYGIGTNGAGGAGVLQTSGNAKH
jgi:hypothetical protein